MSAISLSPFIRFWRPEDAPPLLNGVQLVPEKDLAEQVSDVLLFLSTSHIYNVNAAYDDVSFENCPIHPIGHWIAFVIAWTLCLPLTLLGIVIVQFSASHAELYQTAHATFWEDQLREILGEPRPADPAVIRNEKLKALFEEAISCDYLFEILLEKIDNLPNRDRHIPVPLDCFSTLERTRVSMLYSLLEKLPTNRLTFCMAHCLPRFPGKNLQRHLLEDFFFKSTSTDSTKRESYIVVGFMGMMEAAAKQPEGGLITPIDSVVFGRTSLGDSRSVDDLYRWVSQTQANVDFIRNHKDVIIDQIGRNAPAHRQLINVIHRLTEVRLQPI